MRSKHIPVLDHLRGLAALAVCVFHFSSGNREFLPSDDPIKAIGSFGWLGVEAFFVISGFVIPYSLHLRAYRLRDCVSFFARRLKRLEPPYLACIVLAILLHWLSTLTPGFRGGPLNLTWERLLAHLGYLNAILDYGWLNPVFWTLAIEFQYYIFMALIFPLLAHTNLADRLPESVLYRYPAIFAALAVSVLCAYAFWWIVERPSQRWSKSHAVPMYPEKRDEQSHAPEPAVASVSN